MACREFTLKFVTKEANPDITVVVDSSASVAALVAKVQDAQVSGPKRYMRLVCAGRELYQDDRVASIPFHVLHCIPTDHPPVPRKQRSSVDMAPVDWVDRLDPGTVLMWVFGSVMTFFWLAYLFASHVFDRASVIMLCTMTASFLVPYLFTYIPWSAALLRGPAQPCYPPNQLQGQSGSLHSGTDLDRQGIPPRPPAQIIGPGSSN